MWALLNPFAWGRQLGWIGKAGASAVVVDWFADKTAVVVGYMSTLAYTLWPGLWKDFYKNYQTKMEEAAQVVAAPAADTIRAMTDMPVTAEMMAKIATGGLSQEERYKLGDWFVDVFDQVFDEDAVAKGYLARDAGTAERIVFRNFVGRNAQLQLAGAAVNILKDNLPEGLAPGLGELVERIEKIMGFADSQEEIMEPMMEKIIIAGLEQRFNRITLPTDLAPSDAVQAYLQGLIPADQYKKTLDNAGIMMDIRPVLLQLRAKNLTEADYRDLYQRGEWTRDNVHTAFRGNGYLEEDAQHKTALVTGDRFWKLRNELLNVKESQFVAGVLDEGSFRNYLATMHFDNAEEDIEIEIAKGKASMTKTGKPKQITGTFNVAPWRVKPGNTAMMSWNIRNADTITISGIGTVSARGERVITPDISQTYYLDARSDTDEERFEAAVQVGDTRELKRPTVTFSASPGRIQIGTPVELKWVTGDADTVSIEGIGPVAEAGALAVYPFLSTVYTLRATNAQGTTVRQDIVFVEPPDFDFDKERRPSISFSITPTVVKASQPQAELNWSITRADEGRLTLPDGSTQNVSQNGALIVTATASGIYTLKASNLFGETQNQEALIFQGADEEVP